MTETVGDTLESGPRGELTGSHNLQGKVAIVTGASSGLGRRFARVLADHGMRLTITARRQARLEHLTEELGPDVVHAVAGDIRDPAFIRELIAATSERFGQIDVLVNNAGTAVVRPAEEETVEEFSEVVEINLVSVFACCREVHRLMRASGGGSIVNIASIFGKVGSGSIPHASYGASKGGVVNLTRELAAQWATHGIRVNCIAPGWFPSELTQDMLADTRGARHISRSVPMGRAGLESELDGVLLFLAGDSSTYVTGQTIVVDGGYTAV